MTLTQSRNLDRYKSRGLKKPLSMNLYDCLKPIKKISTLKTVVPKTVTLKGNSFFDGFFDEDCLDSVSTFFSTFLFELEL